MNNQPSVQPANIPQAPASVVIEPSKSPQKRTLFFTLAGLIFVTIVAGSLLGLYFFSSRKIKAPSWQGVKPGVSSKEEVIKTLGTPIEEKQTPLGNTLFYQSDNPVFPHTIIFDQSDAVSSIFVQVTADDQIKFSEWLKNYGQPEKEMYNSYSEFSKTYIFPQKGVAVVANKDFDQIYSVHYFKPTILESYLSQWSNYLFEKNPYLY